MEKHRTPSALTAGAMPSSCNVQRATGRLRSAGMVGPLKSASRTPLACPDRASPRASPAVTKLFPTPPLPLNTATTRRTVASRSATRRRWAVICAGRSERSRSVSSWYVRMLRGIDGKMSGGARLRE